MKTMNGKKFMIYFVGSMILTSIAFCIWIKQAYDTRPIIKIEDVKK
ncbi:MAG: hypothetical protein ABL930_07785 [Pseudobdellovibrio sp.]